MLSSQSADFAASQHDGSGQYPVDRLLAPTTSNTGAKRATSSPAARTSSPRAHATCSDRRGATRSFLSPGTTNVMVRQSSSHSSWCRIQSASSSLLRIVTPELLSATESKMESGPTYL